MGKDYLLGLDVGSNSVGWAATDLDFQPLRLKGKTAWGARVFSEGSDAKKRRGFRTSGRRLARRKFRLRCLRELFEPIISVSDPEFFRRLEESALWAEDKSNPSFVHPLFGSIKDKDFHKTYPTIWHLREKLLENDDAAYSDIRQIYLAIHHMVKYRGNFLVPGEMKIGEFDYSIIERINAFFTDLLIEKTEDDSSYTLINKDDLKAVLDILADGQTAKKEKKKLILDHLNLERKEIIGPFVDFFVALIVGGEFDSSKLGEEGEYEKATISLGKDFDEKEDEYRSLLGDKFEIVECAKIIADHIELETVLGKGNASISKAFVQTYESHRQVKACLKGLVHRIDEKHPCEKEADTLYYKIFKDPDEPLNYAAFVRVGTKTSKPNTKIHDFNKFVEKLLAPYEEKFTKDRDFIGIMAMLRNDDCLRTIAVKSTSVIPHQLHEVELRAVLDMAGKRYPQIEAIKDKVIKTFLFRVPYYYGPLNDKSFYSNVVFKDRHRPLRPWDYREAVDEAATKEAFMSKLTNSCQYLIGEDKVLPRQSVLFMDYVVLNRLNTLVINGAPIEQGVKKDLFDNLISQRKKTTVNQIKNYLIKHYEVYAKDRASISGVNEEDAFDCSTRYALKDCFDFEKDATIIERAVYLLAVYCDYKPDALSAIKSEFPSLTERQFAALKSLQVKGWSSLSARLLVGLKAEGDFGEMVSIMSLLRETAMNFNQIYFSEKYGFKRLVEEENRKHFAGKSKEDALDELIEGLPPKMRRPLIQAIRIVDEVVRIAKKEPKAVALEVTRESPETKNKGQIPYSRKKVIEKFLKTMLKEDEAQKSAAKTLGEELAALDQKNELGRLKAKRIYLYFMQNGFDLYTGKMMNIADVISGKYDIDHIFPQSKIKDDSLDNCVLVDKEYNSRVKQDLYPIPEQIRCNPDIRNLWKILRRHGSISDKKYNRLTRASELTDEELNDFVNAQINVVNYANKGIVNALNLLYPEMKVIFSKAEFPSFLRQELGIYKIRDLNDAHHAVDAYLNIVTGTILHSTYSNLRVVKALERKGEKVTTYNMRRTLQYYLCKKEGGLTPLGEKVVKTCSRTDFLLTYRLNYGDGGFYSKNNAQKKKDGLIPVHESLADTAKYGGYDGLSNECMVVATVREAKKSYRYLLPVPWVVSSLPDNETKERALKEAFLKANPKAIDLSIDLAHPIYNGQKVRIRGCHYLMSNANIDQVGLVPVDLVLLRGDLLMYISRFLSYKELLRGVPREIDSFTVQSSLDGETRYIFTKNKNECVFEQIGKIVSKQKYDYFAGIGSVRSRFSTSNKESFVKLSLYEQIDLCLRLLFALTRSGLQTSQGIVSSLFRKNRRVIFDEKILVLHESVTGLIRHEVEL